MMQQLPAVRRFGNLSPMGDLMDSFFNGFGYPAEGQRWLPAVELTETDEGYVVHAEVPGLAPDDVEVTLEGDTLTIRGERKPPVRNEKERVHVDERRYGGFVRTFQFPGPVASESVTAETLNGILTVHVGKANEARPRRIEVRSVKHG